MKEHAQKDAYATSKKKKQADVIYAKKKYNVVSKINTAVIEDSQSKNKWKKRNNYNHSQKVYFPCSIRNLLNNQNV